MPKKSPLPSDKNEEMIIHNIRFPRLNESFKPRWWLVSFFYGFCIVASITFLFHCVIRLIVSIIGK